jgi:hypothetical protein
MAIEDIGRGDQRAHEAHDYNEAQGQNFKR